MAGIAFLRKLLMKQAVKKSAQASGIMSIGSDVRKLVEKKLGSYIDSAQRQGVDLDKMSEQEIKYILEMNKPKPIKAIPADSPEGKLFTQGMMDMLDKASGKNVIKGDFGSSVTDTVLYIKTLEPIDAMKEANKVLKGEGRYKSLSKADREQIVNDETVTDHIFERNIKPDPYDFDPEDFAQGGRTGTGLNYLLGEDDQNTRVPYGAGGISKARRAFLKMMAGVGATGAAAKSGLFGLLKSGKPAATVVKDLTSVPIGNPPGMPAWFKPLVNKVIKEGEDVTKQFSTKEREIVHQVSLEGKIGSPDALGVDDIRVTQSLDDGSVRVQYNTVDSPGEYGVDLIYKQGEWIEPTVGKKGQIAEPGMKTSDEFKAVEAEPRYTGGPDDADLEWDGENLVDNVDDLLTDTTKLEAYATGKKPNIKKLLKSEQKQKKTKKLNESNVEQAEYIEEKYGPGPDWDDILPEGDEGFGKASGGRVPRSGGGIMKLLKLLKSKPKKSNKRIDLEKLLKGDKKIPVYSGSMKRQSNTWQSFIEDAKLLGTTPEKIAKDKFKGQWFTPFRDYAESFMDPKDLTSKMRTVELDPKEIAMAKRYVDKVNKTDIISMRKKLGIKPYPKQTITTDENLVLIPKYKLKELEKTKRMKTDYMILEKLKKKIGLAEGGRVSLSSGGLAGMLGE